MHHQAARPVVGTDAEGILRELTTRQHLTPHRPLGDVVSEIVKHVSACPAAAEGAMERLELDAARSIGRLRRGELIQLARGMYRLWMQNLATASRSEEASEAHSG
jgi:hypothetical protein